MRKRFLTVATLSAGLLASAFAADPPGQVIDSPLRQVVVPDGTNPLEGTYVIVSGERDGKPLDAARFEGSVVRITKDKMIGTDKDKKELFVAEYTVDATITPEIKVKMISKQPKSGTEATGLVKRDGDTLTIVYNLPGGDAPTSFKTEKNQHMFVLKRTLTPAEAVREKTEK
jgi:uncharacterized protein (TIGR03067 family)